MGVTVLITTVVRTDGLEEAVVDAEEDDDLDVVEAFVVVLALVVVDSFVVVEAVVEGVDDVVLALVVVVLVVVVVVLLCLRARRTSSLATAGFSACTCSIAVRSLLKTPSLYFGFKELRTALSASSLVSPTSL